jgi:hypothetical protein
VATWQTTANAYITACAGLGITPEVWGRPADVKVTPRRPAHHNAGHWAYIATALVNHVPAVLGRRR